MVWKNEKDFVCRTKHNLELYKKYKSTNSKGFEFEQTQLVNSFLGLIVFVKESGIASNAELDKFLQNNKPKEWEYAYKGKEELHDFKNYLRHLRNSIARLSKKSLVTNKKNNEISSIAFYDKDTKNPKNIFKSKLSIKKIEELIGLLSKEFLGQDKCAESGRVDG